MKDTGFTDKVYKYCTDRKLLVGVMCIVAGLSGGPDSVALVSALCRLKDEYEDFPKIYAVHVNHGLRESAGYDEELSRKLCEELNIPFKAYHFDVRKKAEELGRGLEETGRILRYEAFRETASSAAEELSVDEDAVKIATAHHLGDLSETFMMNLFRGSGLEGLTGMNSSGSIIRPLLNVTKDEILEFLEDNHIDYATDETNFLTDFTRNKWRNEIFPVIREVSVKDPYDAICDTYRLLSQDESYIEGEALIRYAECVVRTGGVSFIKIRELKKLHPALSTRVIRLCWKETFGSLTDFETKHVDIINALTEISGGTHYADMPFGRKAMCVEGLLGFYGEEGPERTACAMAVYLGFPAAAGKIDVRIRRDELKNGEKTIELPEFGLSIQASVVENNVSMVYNTFSWICPEDDIVIGTDPGEGTFRKAGSPHRTDLTKLMSDMKVPRDARRHLIAVRSGGRVLWIPGIGHSEGFISSKSREAWLKDGGRTGGTLIRLDILTEVNKGGNF